jgi:hypothetical protein
MTTEQRQAVERLVASLVDGSWVRPARNPATEIRARGPSVELGLGGRIDWWVCERKYGRQLFSRDSQWRQQHKAGCASILECFFDEDES